MKVKKKVDGRTPEWVGGNVAEQCPHAGQNHSGSSVRDHFR